MNGEKGQALPLAILALTIGMLLIAPFLGHASASVIGSRIYADAIAYRNACDAGVEHAIWRLVYGGLQTSLPNPGDHVTYQLSEAINNVTPSVTITANATGGGGATGNITKTVIDTLDFDISSGYEPDIIQVSSNVYAIAYKGVNGNGFMKTVSIDTSGNIGNSAIDTLEFDTIECKYVDITYVSGNIFALAYQGPGDNGYVKTVSIDASGNIGNSVIDTLEFDTINGREPAIIQITSSIYAIVYHGPSDDGFVKTVSIDTSGNIGDSVIDTLEFDTSDGHLPTIIHVSGSIYAIAYKGSSGNGFIKTVSIDTSGNIGDSVIDTLEFDTTDCKYVDITNISGNIFAVAYQGPGDNGYVKTVSIDSSGNIGNSVIDTLEFDISAGRLPNIIYVSGSTYAIAYEGSGNDGFIKTISIDSSGNIGNSVIDTLEFDTSAGFEPDIINISNGIYAIAYRGPGNDGYLKTIGITTGSGASIYRIVATAGDTSIQAYVSTSGTTASILSWQIK
jgi:hypothetical protein